MYAVRNNRLCTKDCLCLYVCPTGATDTEDGQIDRNKCIGCGVCARSCPAATISMAPEKDRIPKQQPNEKAVIDTLLKLTANKSKQETVARQLAERTADNSKFKLLAKALERSNRIMAEGLLSEAGFMVPQGENTQVFLESTLINAPADFPIETVEKLLIDFQRN